jgi:hypothetical protein
MTAYRIVDQYIDLDDVPSGSYAPVDINQILNDYLNLSSSLPTTYANISASYLLTQHNSYLPHYRVLVTGSGIVFNLVIHLIHLCMFLLVYIHQILYH